MGEVYRRYREQIHYLFFGILTTVVNIVVYYIYFEIVGISNIVSTLIAWVVSVLFAYITNKLWVFENETSTVKEVTYELVKFIMLRVATGALDIGIMALGVDVLGYHGISIKIVSNVIVIVSNYIASKLIIFK